MTSSSRRILLLIAIAAIIALARSADSLQGISLNADPIATFTQLAKCYPKKTPCQAGNLIGRRLAKSTAYFVVMEKGTLESGLGRVKQWVEKAKSSDIDNVCLMKSFKTNYKLFYEIYMERVKNTCTKNKDKKEFESTNDDKSSSSKDQTSSSRKVSVKTSK